MWTTEERKMIMDYATLMTGKKSGKAFKEYTSKTAVNIKYFIERYGDDGYGDEPKDMSRVEYWIAHL